MGRDRRRRGVTSEPPGRGLAEEPVLRGVSRPRRLQSRSPLAPGPPAIMAQGSELPTLCLRVLSFFGLLWPPLRSSELWADTSATTLADQPAPLDLAPVEAEPYERACEGADGGVEGVGRGGAVTDDDGGVPVDQGCYGVGVDGGHGDMMLIAGGEDGCLVRA
jgi:hypothetical protein